jgi:hypothetical protein
MGAAQVILIVRQTPATVQLNLSVELNLKSPYTKAQPVIIKNYAGHCYLVNF